MHLRSLLAPTCVAMFLCVASAHAQDTFTGSVTTTDSTSPERQRQSALWQERGDRAIDFRAKTQAVRHGRELFAEYRSAYARNRLEQAIDCRRAQRKANKDAVFSVTARCYRTSLLLEREFWQKHVQQVENLPGITDDVRGETLYALDSMIDAIDTIILGIDSNVYDEEEELQDAKKNLHSKFRAPVSLALSRFRADHTQTWIAHLMSRMLYLIESEEVNEESFEKMQQASYCLEMGELFMKEIQLEPDYKRANLLLSQSLQHLLTCGDFLREAYDLAGN